jgi:hypothetical protein
MSLGDSSQSRSILQFHWGLQYLLRSCCWKYVPGGHHICAQFTPCWPLQVLLSDWILIRKCKAFNLSHLYKPHGLYWYWRGWNPRAIAALVVGIVPLLPGLIYNINPDIPVGQGILEFYTLGWLDGLVIASYVHNDIRFIKRIYTNSRRMTYYLLFLVFPFQTVAHDDSETVIEGRSSGQTDSDVKNCDKTDVSCV